MDRCPKDEPTAKNSVWNKSSSHSREKLEKPVRGGGGGGGWPPEGKGVHEIFVLEPKYYSLF